MKSFDEISVTTLTYSVMAFFDRPSFQEDNGSSRVMSELDSDSLMAESVVHDNIEIISMPEQIKDIIAFIDFCLKENGP